MPDSGIDRILREYIDETNGKISEYKPRYNGLICMLIVYIFIVILIIFL